MDFFLLSVEVSPPAEFDRMRLFQIVVLGSNLVMRRIKMSVVKTDKKSSLRGP